MQRIRKNGSTSNIEECRLLQDGTGANPGYGKTGLSSSSTGLVISTKCDNESSETVYTQTGGTIQTITTIGTYAAPSASNCRFKEVDSANAPGKYQLMFADARYSVSGAKTMTVTISGVSGMLPRQFLIQLSSVDMDDGIHGGITALPNAAAGATNGLPTVDGSNQVKANLTAAVGTTIVESLAGQVAKGLAVQVSAFGTATAGGASTLTLQTATTANLYRRNRITIIAGTGAIQTMNITSNTTTVVTVDQPWTIQPDNTSQYIIWSTDEPLTDTAGRVTALIGDANSGIIQQGVALGGGASTITIATALGTTVDIVGCIVKIGVGGGTGGTQQRVITGYVDATKVVTVDRPWATAPDSTSVYAIMFASSPKLDSSLRVLANTDQFAGQTITAAAGVTIPSSIASPTNITAASGITLAANQHVIVDSGTVTTVSGNVNGSVGSISGISFPTNFSTLSVDSSGRVLLQPSQPSVRIPNVTLCDTITTYTGNTPQTGDGFSIVNSGSYGNQQLLTAVQNVQNNTFIAAAIPQEYAIPASGTQTVNITFAFSDETGAAKNLDGGNPTITLVNDAGTDRSSRLGSWTNPATGKYIVPYTASSSDTLEGLHWDVSGTINSKLRRTVGFTQLVATFTSTFTSTDRTMLTNISNKLPTNNIADETVVLAAIGTPMQAYTQPTGFLSATFPTTVASPTNITSGTITTVTNLTNAPTSGDLTSTMKTSVATATQTGMTSQGYTTTRAGYMDVLNGIVAAIWASATRTLTAFGFNVTLSDSSISTNAANAASSAATAATNASTAATNATSAATAASAAQTAASAAQTAATGANTAATTAASQTTAAAIRTAVGLASANLDAQFTTTQADIAALNTGAGTGSIAVTITVNDGTNTIQNALVTMQINASRYSAYTNSSGVAVLSPNEGAGTYAVRISAGGYQFTPTSLTVASATSQIYSMIQLVITPSTPPEITGYLTAYDTSGNAALGIAHSLQFVSAPNLATGSAFDAGIRTVNSDSSGLVQFTGLRVGATYKVKRGSGKWSQFVASDSGNGTCQLPDCVG